MMQRERHIATQRQAAVGTFWATVERVATQGISFIVVLLLARLLGPQNYGLVTLAATIGLLGQMLLSETFSQALIQQKDLEAAHVSSLFWILVAAGILAVSIQLMAAGSLSILFGEPDLAPLLRALSPVLLLSALQAVPISLFKRDLDFRSLAAASATGTLIAGAAGVALAYAGFGVWSLIANLLVQSTVVTATIWRRSSFRPGLVLSLPHLRDLWSYGQFTFLLRIAAFAANQSPRILIGYLFGPAALGAFSLGLRVIEIIHQLLTLPAVNVALPLISRVRSDPNRLERVVLAATQLVAMTSVPVFVGLALIAPFAMPLVFGVKWVQSVPLVQILCAFGIVGAFGLIWGGIIGGLGRPDVTLATTTMAALVSVTLLLATARWGLIAAATAYVIRGYATLPFMPHVIARLTGIRAATQYRVCAPILLAVAIMAMIAEAVILTIGDLTTPAIVVAAATLAGVLGYGLALYLVALPAFRLGASFLGQLRPRQETA
jgi:O-antigen/teichoic acid export membrane protein